MTNSNANYPSKVIDHPLITRYLNISDILRCLMIEYMLLRPSDLFRLLNISSDSLRYLTIR